MHSIPAFLIAGARVIDGRGKFVTTGLMDANVHLAYGVSIEFLARYEDRPDDPIAEGAQVALANGLTTVFDSLGNVEKIAMVIKDGVVVDRATFPVKRVLTTRRAP